MTQLGKIGAAAARRWSIGFVRVFAVVFALGLGGLFAAPASAQGGGLVLRDVQGTLADGGRFVGNVRIRSVERIAAGDGDVILANGVLNGTATLADGTVREIRGQAFAAPIELFNPGPTLRNVCQVLNLDIGRIRLNLLGLIIDLAPISLDIVAVPGGGLLGDLLCALSGLLDGIPTLDQLTTLLRRLNAALSNL